MALTFKTPGVHIIEVQTPGPIAGVGTSTAAFVGPAMAGDFLKPTKLVNWTQFTNLFGVEKPGQPLKDPYNSSPRIFMPHAVRGFFDNGGTVCYIVRVGTGVKASLALEDRAASAPATNALRAVAKQEGLAGNNITVQVDDAHIATTKAVRANTAIASAVAINSTTATVTAGDGKKFSVGDTVLISEAALADTGVITKIDGDTLTFETALANAYTVAGVIRIANLVTGQRAFRVEDTRGIEIGSVITIAQGATTESIVVVGVSAAVQASGTPRPGFVTLPPAGLTNGYTMVAADADVTVVTQEFKLTMKSGTKVEIFDKLSMEPAHSRYFSKVVDSTLVEIELPATPSPAAPPKNQPKVIAATALAGGVNDDLSGLGVGHFTAGIAALEKVDDVNILCVPDRTDAAVQNEMIAHCEKMQDRFAILDPKPTPNIEPLAASGILFQRNSLAGSPRGFAALYYPRVVISNPDPLVGGTLTVAPSGHLAGIYARSDANRGVHKAPANEAIQNILGLEHVLNDAEQGELNEQQVDALRVFPGLGPTVWGARTISTETAWRYVSSRRLFLFLEESIQEGTRFAVFEPNDLALWGKIKRVATDFLTRVWRSGALFGASQEEAFYVKVDEELNPPDVRALGQVIIEVGVLLAFPAEFVIFRIGQKSGGAEVTELS